MTNLLKRLQIYWVVWSKTAQYAVSETLVNRWSNLFFMFGKTIRFAMLLFFLLLIQKNIQHFAGYTTSQVIIFFLTYQFIDSLGQVIFRGVYEFSWQVRSGELDFYLAKPINPLFRILTGKPDILDAIFIVPTTVVSIWLATQLHITYSWPAVFVYLALLVNGMLVITSFMIFVICLGILTTEVDNAIMLFRDINTLSRFPVDIYKEPLRTVLFFIVPVGIMNTIPSQVVMNLQPSFALPLVFAVGFGFFLISLWTWKFSLKKYTSAGG